MARLALVALVTVAVPMHAFHRQTPAVVAVTSSGDANLPRVAAGGRRLAVALEANGRQIFRQNRHANALEALTTTGDNANPTISESGAVVAWDSDCTLLGYSDPGRQIFLWNRGASEQITHDPTGTSVNPALNGRGSRVAFESLGDLAGTGTTGVRQIFARDNDGSLTQVSHGYGISRNPVLSRDGRSVVFESTGDAAGTDTGVAQIWLAQDDGSAAPITSGAGPSRLPAISQDARTIVFQSNAALTEDGRDTGVSQVFAYDVRSGGFTQITGDPLGCSNPSVSTVHFADWRIGYVCHGTGFYYHLRRGERFQLPFAGGDTIRVAELGSYFLAVDTTANLLGTGTTAGHRIDMLNLYARPGVPVTTP